MQQIYVPFPSNFPPEAPNLPAPHNGLGKTGVGPFCCECVKRPSCHAFDSPELPGPPYVLLSGGRGLLKIEGGALSAGPSIVTEFPDIGAKLGCHSLIMLTIRLNHSGKSHKIPLSTLQWLFPIPSFSTWGGLEREENWFLCF